MGYDSVKVLRIDRSEHVATVKDFVQTLNLPHWTHDIVENSHVDMEVPMNKLRAFKRGTKGLHVSVMHDDLGASIHTENEYRGPSPGSTPEFKALSVFQNRLAGTLPSVKLYIDWHSYAQLFLAPYGYSCSVIAADSAELSSLAHGYANAARGLYNTTYKAGPVCNTVYKASGSAIDYSYDVSKI